MNNNSLLTLSHIHKNEQYFYRYPGRFIVNLCKLCLMLCEMFYNSCNHNRTAALYEFLRNILKYYL